MYVCMCKGVTDKQLKDAVKAGATTLRCLRDQLGVASTCGACARLVRDQLDEHTRTRVDAAQFLQPLNPASAVLYWGLQNG